MDIALKNLEDFNRKDKNKIFSLFHILTHEIGHPISLSYQYPKALDSMDKIYGTIEPRRSLMDSVGTLDGMVLLFDDALGIRRKNFNSLCNNDIKFSYGKESFKGKKVCTYDDTYSMTYNENTKDTGIYEYELSNYVSTYSKEESELIDKSFDFSKMSKNTGGYQTSMGNMWILDFDDSEKRISIGIHKTILTLRAGATHKQILTEEFNNAGKLLRYTLEIYYNGNLIETKIINPKK